MKRITALLAACALPALASAQMYVLQDLGTIAGQSEAFAIDLGGTALGASTQGNGHFRAVQYYGSQNTLPELFGFNEHYAFGADSQGRIYGTSYSLGDMTCGAFRISNGVAQGLGSFAARAVNPGGLVAGTAPTATSGLTVPRACSFDGNALTTLPTLGGVTGLGLAIDDAGRIVGSSTTANEASVRPCVWIAGIVHDLGTLGGANGQATGIRAGMIVGNSQNAAGLRRATMWTIDGAGTVISRIDLGALGAASSYALGVNTAGAAVGTSGFHATLYNAGQAIDLNAHLINGTNWTVEKAWAIADDGTIVGTGTYLGFPRAFRLTPHEGYCTADYDHNGFVNGDDFDSFSFYFFWGDPRADIDLNGFVNGDDYDTFSAAFEAGC